MDSVATHTILKSKAYFRHLVMGKANVNTIIDSTKVIEGSKRATILFPGETKFIINYASLSPMSQRNLLSLKNIC